MSAGRVFVCSVCSAVAEGDPSRRGCGLPRGWEHYDAKACTVCVITSQRPPTEAARPVCGDCIRRLLEDLMEAMRVAWGRAS